MSIHLALFMQKVLFVMMNLQWSGQLIWIIEAYICILNAAWMYQCQAVGQVKKIC